MGFRPREPVSLKLPVQTRAYRRSFRQHEHVRSFFPIVFIMASVFVPVAYVIIVFGGLFIFSYFYRKHTSSMSSALSHFIAHFADEMNTICSPSLRTLFPITSRAQCIRHTPSNDGPACLGRAVKVSSGSTCHGRCSACVAYS